MAVNIHEYRRELVLNANDINRAGRNKCNRIPVCFLIDCSGGGSFVLTKLNKEMHRLMDYICRNPELRAGVEIMVMSYGQKVECLRSFALIQAESSLELQVHPTQEIELLPAIKEAWYQIRRQKQIYQCKGINYSQPTIFLFATGKHEADTADLEEFCRIRNMAGKVSIVPITYSEDPLFARISTKGRAYRLQDCPVENLFDRIQNSLQRMSDSSGQAYATLLDASRDWDL